MPGSLKAETNEGLGSPKHKLLSYTNYTLLREEMCSMIYLFAVTSRKVCQDSLTVLAHGQVLFSHTNWSQGHKNTPGLLLPFAEETFPREKIAEMNQKLIFGIRLHSSSSQVKNLNAPIKPSAHPSTEAKGSAVGAQRDCILGIPRGTAAGSSQHWGTEEPIQEPWPDKIAHIITRAHLASPAPEEPVLTPQESHDAGHTKVLVHRCLQPKTLHPEITAGTLKVDFLYCYQKTDNTLLGCNLGARTINQRQ